MAEEVYEGAIGIDLGMESHELIYKCFINANLLSQARPTLVSPTMRAQMSKSVR